ncbi:VIT1/CCC1 transporter family protein [Nocardiopsis suaedae]|uniref:VIT family protein n=1 Tax=Nocardiopsis suaedae TaxID=3018444 RepID=A0ABT4TRS8_9ACTN|nr:VIT family protein [Nocardiopsis suaedae]MDA2807378.1 VIT family protein [Nocardiopsis suaedae]
MAERKTGRGADRGTSRTPGRDDRSWAGAPEAGRGADGLREPREPHHESLGSRLNWLRAGVLGANDGIVSTAGLVVGVAGATASGTAILVAGVAGMFSGALSMAAGEYVSVSTQRDTERAALARERRELEEDPEAELEELAGMYRDRGLDADLARRVAEQLTARDALRAHAEVELRLDSDELTDPWQAALASFLSFVVGALVPLLLITLSPGGWRVPVTIAAVAGAVAVTGAVSARLGGAGPRRAALRSVVGGLLAMAVTFGIGTAVGGATGM